MACPLTETFQPLKGRTVRPFRYVNATTIDDVVSVLSEHGPKARCLAGGTDLLAQTRVGRYELDVLVDVKGVPETSQVRLDSSGLYIGASVPCYQLYEDEKISTAYPGIIDAASLIGGIQIQSRATLGGNLCNASPSADSVCPLIVYGAVAVVAGSQGIRKIPVEEFNTGPGATVLQRGEFLLGLQLPKPAAHFGAAYQRFIPRNEMDIAVVGVASAVTLDTTGEQIESARIALASVGPTAILAKQAGDSLAGKPATAESISDAATLAMEATSPITDIRGTEHQRRQLIGVFARRTLQVAIQRAKGA
jgi:carbon-monoxide dehydrogenase medium subunit